MIINFARGHPNPGLLPVDPMKELLQLVQEEGNLIKYLNYPPQDEGNSELLLELEQFLERQSADDELPSGGACRSNKFFVTHGVSHALDLLCGVLSQSGDSVGVEIPTYFLVSEIFQNHGLTITTLPMKTTEDGQVMMDVQKLLNELQSGSRTPPRLIYMIPTHHNPTASTLPLPDRELLAQVARDYHIFILCDEVYHLLDWSDQRRPSRMACFNQEDCSISDTGCCVSISSFTKIFCPGIRCGWVEAPAYVINKLIQYGYIQSQGGCAPFVGELLTRGLQAGMMDTILQQLCQAYKERSTLLCQTLTTTTTSDAPNSSLVRIMKPPQGGYFLWIQLPVDATEFSAYTLKHGIRILPGQKCQALAAECHHFPNDCVDNYARLCFADLSLQDLKTGATQLLELLEKFMESGTS